MADANTALLKDSIEVKLPNGNSYEFAIPSFVDEIKLGMCERDIRREVDPTNNGSADGLDNSTAFFVASAAIFRVLLRKASVEWPYSKDAKGGPVVDYTKWPKDKVGEALEVAATFQTELVRFRSGRVADGQSPDAETVAGQ